MSDVGTADLFVYVPDPDFSPTRDQNADTKFMVGCTHESGRIPWGRPGFTRLNKPNVKRLEAKREKLGTGPYEWRCRRCMKSFLIPLEDTDVDEEEAHEQE